MFNHLVNESFIKWVLEQGKIPFVVHGSLTCPLPISFGWGVKINSPTHKVVVSGQDVVTKEEAKLDKIYFHDLVNETVFKGEIQLKAKTREAIADAITNLEVWADLLCLAHGNPKIEIEVQVPVRAVSGVARIIEQRHVQKWHELLPRMFRLTPEQQQRVERGLWWYRKGCNAYSYSRFDAYAAFWNVLEILCGVGHKTHKGAAVDEAVQKYLQSKLDGKRKITGGDIITCYNNIVNYSIAAQVKNSLNDILQNEKQAEQWSHYCFHVKPDRDRLYQIRNDINHGNIRENDVADLRRVYLRGLILQELVFCCLNRMLGFNVRAGKDDIHAFVEKTMSVPEGYFADPLFI